MRLRYLDCRQPLYERLTFVLHRVETDFDFISIPAITADIWSLKLSLQLDIRHDWPGRREAQPRLPWHGSGSQWRQLQSGMANLENLRHPDVWLDAADQLSRCMLVSNEEAFDFGRRFVSFMRVPIPLYQSEDREWYYPITFERREGVFGRGMAEYWQTLDIAPVITFYLHYMSSRLYERPVDCDRGKIHHQSRTRTWSIIGDLSRVICARIARG